MSNNGQFKKGRIATNEELIKRGISLRNSWKNRSNYIGDIKNEYPKLYNSWRGIRFTEKGKKAGNSVEWNDFKTFYSDVIDTYKPNLVLRRKDFNKPFSKENFMWITSQEAANLNDVIIRIEFNNKCLTLKEWANETTSTYQSIKNRYYKRDKYNFSVEEIIFGRKKKRGSKTPKDFRISNIRAKASKMISTHKIRDKQKGFDDICDIDIDWMIENIFKKTCVYCGDDKNVGCDRLDNSLGHLKSNVVPCCVTCNTARSNLFSFEEMKQLGETIRNIKKCRLNRN